MFNNFSIAQDSIDGLMAIIRYLRNRQNFIYPNFIYKQCTLLARSERTFIEKMALEFLCTF